MQRGLTLYLVVAFGVAWALWGLVALHGGLAHPQAGALLAASMFAPTLGTLAAWRWADPDAISISGVRRRGPWRWFPVAYLLVPALLLLGAALAVLVGIQQPDPTFSVLQELIRQQTAQSGVDPPPMPISQIATIGALFALTIAPIVNTLPAAGEELGWRGYLLARLQPLGPRRASLLVGLIWGIWHAPIVVQGHNYPGEPLLGPLLMTVLTLAYGVILAWLRARAGSIWPAALAHGTLNAQGGAVAMFLTPANPLVGAPIGLIALIPTLLLALALLRFAPWEPSTSSRAPIGRDY